MLCFGVVLSKTVSREMPKTGALLNAFQLNSHRLLRALANNQKSLEMPPLEADLAFEVVALTECLSQIGNILTLQCLSRYLAVVFPQPVLQVRFLASVRTYTRP